MQGTGGLTMRVLGMISGTSADAIEVVACDIDGAPPTLSLTVMAARTAAIADLAAATDLLDRYVKRERIPAVVRRKAERLGNRSLLEIAQRGDTRAVADHVAEMFDLRRVQP